MIKLVKTTTKKLIEATIMVIFIAAVIYLIGFFVCAFMVGITHGVERIAFPLAIIWPIVIAYILFRSLTKSIRSK
jgi:biotin transporter BioY